MPGRRVARNSTSFSKQPGVRLVGPPGHAPEDAPQFYREQGDWYPNPTHGEEFRPRGIQQSKTRCFPHRQAEGEAAELAVSLSPPPWELFSPSGLLEFLSMLQDSCWGTQTGFGYSKLTPKLLVTEGTQISKLEWVFMVQFLARGNCPGAGSLLILIHSLPAQ